MSGRFEIVHSDGVGYDDHQYWHARFRAANGRIVWTTEQYQRRGAATNAIVALASALSWGEYAVMRGDSVRIAHGGFHDSIEVRLVDERKASA